MKKITTTLLTVLTALTFAYGQNQNATTESGKKVILLPNGTWKYEDTIKTAATNLDPKDCANWIKTEEDKVTGKSYTDMKEYLIISKDGGKKGFGINLMLSSSGSIIYSIKAVGASGCIDKGAKINILFTDGSRLELASDADFNCKGSASVYLGETWGKKSQLSELKLKKIDIMRVWTSDSFVEEKFETDQAEQLLNAFNCLSK